MIQVVGAGLADERRPLGYGVVPRHLNPVQNPRKASAFTKNAAIPKMKCLLRAYARLARKGFDVPAE